MKKYSQYSLTSVTVAFALLGSAIVCAADRPGGAAASVPLPSAPTTLTAPAKPDVKPLAADLPRLLPLQGAHNVRSFANLKGSHGPIPANSFLRADDLTRLTQADRDKLAAAGVSLDLDLRSGDEAQSSPDALATDPRFKYTRISLMGSERMDISTLPDSLGEMYVKSLSDVQPQFRQVFQTMAAQKDGTVLFHCTAGKDRTGMISALLLSLAGVPRSEIVHNYAITAHYIRPTIAQNHQAAQMLEKNPRLIALMGSEPENMEMFLDALERQYGGARGYLKTIGVSDGEVNSLLARLGQTGH